MGREEANDGWNSGEMGMVLICKDEETEKQEWKMGIIDLQEDENEEGSGANALLFKTKQRKM